ncbi:MAG: hypothetical protein U0S76_13410 [Pseudoxanthomonas sp.]|nr:hypothetical protein [Pseudoxanthomonas sp.]
MFRCTRFRLLAALGLALAGAAGLAVAKSTPPATLQGGVAPVVRVISGTPLTIHVGADQSFQVFNADVPGQGQIYPSDSGPDTADMGWFVRIGGTLFAPDFDNHPAGSATGGLGTYTPFANSAISAVTGTGSAADPFRVTVTGTLPGQNVNVTQAVEYVNGNNYFTKRLSLANTGGANLSAQVYLGGDIYLASSDSGVPFREPVSGSVGGQTCPPTDAPAGAGGTYTILFIPQTPADFYSGNGYSTVWNQIGSSQLSNTLAAGCLDNGAALQWNRSLPAGSTLAIQASTSFGDIPPIAQFNVSAVNPASGSAGTSVPVTITGFGFQPGTTFDFGAGITVGGLVIVNATTATATLSIAGGAAPGPRNVTGTQSPGGLVSTLVNGFTVISGTQPPPATATPVPVDSPWALLLLALSVLLMAGLVVRRG